MPTYITVGTFTQQGIENVKDSPNRISRARAAFSAAGGELKEFFVVMGRYDFIVIGDLPNDQAAATIALAIGSQGNVRTETLRAFNEEEYAQVIQALP